MSQVYGTERGFENEVLGLLSAWRPCHARCLLFHGGLLQQRGLRQGARSPAFVHAGMGPRHPSFAAAIESSTKHDPACPPSIPHICFHCMLGVSASEMLASKHYWLT